MDTFSKVCYGILASTLIALGALVLYITIVRVNMEDTLPQTAPAITIQGCVAVAEIGTDRAGQILPLSEPNPNKLVTCLESSGWTYTRR